MRVVVLLVVILALCVPVASADTVASRSARGVDARAERLSDGRYALVASFESGVRRRVVLPRTLSFNSVRFWQFGDDRTKDPLFTFSDGGCCLRGWLLGSVQPRGDRWRPTRFTLRTFGGGGQGTYFATRALRFARSFGRGPVNLAPLLVYAPYFDTALLERHTRDRAVRPALRRDAARLRRVFLGGRDSRRVAAAYADEECVLGRCATGYALARSRFGPRFLRTLRARLRRRRDDVRRRVSVSRAGMTAQLTYDDTRVLGVEEHITMRAWLHGRRVVNRVLTGDLDDGYNGLRVSASQKTRPPLVAIRDLDGDGVPQAIFGLNDSSSHGTLVLFMSWGSTLVEHSWFNASYRLRDLDRDGAPEILTNQDFHYIRTPMSPTQVLEMVGPRLVDVTRTALARPVVRAAAHHLRRPSPGNGYKRWQDAIGLVSYAADECSLERCGRGYRFLRRVVRRHPKARYLQGLARRARVSLRRYGYDRP